VIINVSESSGADFSSADANEARYVTEGASAATVSPTLLHTLNPSDNVDAVIGLGVVDDIVYIVRSWTSNVELYSAVSLKPMKPIQVLSLDLPHDMVACTSQKCLYLSDYGSDIHRIEVSGYRMQTKWNAGDRPTGLSLTAGAANVLVTYENGQKVFITIVVVVAVVLVLVVIF